MSLIVIIFTKVVWKVEELPYAKISSKLSKNKAIRALTSPVPVTL